MIGCNKDIVKYYCTIPKHYDEFKWLYCEVYHNDMKGFYWLCNSLYGYYKERSAELKKIDRQREKNPNWYSTNDVVGMMLYVDAFAGDLKGVKSKIEYLKECGVNYLHLMSLLKVPRTGATAAMRCRTFFRCSLSSAQWRTFRFLPPSATKTE